MEINVNSEGMTKPAEQLREIVSRAEELLVSLGDSGDAAVGQLRQRVKTTIRNAKDKLNTLDARARQATGTALIGTNTFVRENPWTAVAVAAAAGAVLGAIVARRG